MLLLHPFFFSLCGRGPRSAERFVDVRARPRPPRVLLTGVLGISTDLIEATWLGPHRGPGHPFKVLWRREGCMDGCLCLYLAAVFARGTHHEPVSGVRARSRRLTFGHAPSVSAGCGCAYALTFGEGRTLASAPLPIWREPRAMRLCARSWTSSRGEPFPRGSWSGAVVRGARLVRGRSHVSPSDLERRSSRVHARWRQEVLDPGRGRKPVKVCRPRDT